MQYISTTTIATLTSSRLLGPCAVPALLLRLSLTTAVAHNPAPRPAVPPGALARADAVPLAILVAPEVAVAVLLAGAPASPDAAEGMGQIPSSTVRTTVS